uniref:RNA-dependent RNA polymerase n=1 Tax=Rhizophora mucronata TaxID=61149 RepID=A0A2P2QNV3_RHIMU
MEDFVGNAKYGIFFSSRGPRSVADEMAGGDYDGDMYFVSQNSQLLETFKQSDPWTSASSTFIVNTPERRPSEFSDNELEDELFKLFLATRFKPSYNVGMAAESWQVGMDRLLTLGDDCTVEKDLLKKNMCKLIEIYYEALDAPKKSGKKIEIPDELKAELFPHYMEKKDFSSYNSSSILGKIFDTVKSYEEDDSFTIKVGKLQWLDSEVPESCRLKWDKLYHEYRQEMSAACNVEKYNDGKDDAADAVIKKYKQILYGAAEFDESKRAENDIFNDALAIYEASYDYASLRNDAAKCGFAWRVAGSALCKLYLKREDVHPRTLFTSVSAMRDIYG